MKLDILAIAAHPDDVELGCAGTLLAQMALGKKVGILDLTRGELGTRGTPEGRIQEARNAADILGIEVRDNVGLADGFFKNDEVHQRAIIPYIRKYQPDIVLANAVEDRHPDHGRGGQLIYESCFYSGLRMIETYDAAGNQQEAWRPKNVFHMIQDRYIKPDFVVDITPFWEKKVSAMLAFESQFFVPKENPMDDSEPQSYISSPEFMDFIKARAEEFGHAIGVKYGEGFTSRRQLGVQDISVFY
ncbi:bacillithiol biosynthesis deacetylase BshB1 [Persicitalea jodogahamensis]|uniref:Bacillithiol biosynthesis deacetylase BshB1 n=1 Tax=Persicitalea jodogahamensis TaxID=402147 RepID=A0A8J3GBQ0_9BACT|nr:bacillithiol biosynthesis deacetylase BshB1 [Persicitalea jodogahamensis]GHB79299.1 bacillithiol biosynthesis deacetylase BshB1 [Persicitalea jodogahamensis]